MKYLMFYIILFILLIIIIFFIQKYYNNNIIESFEDNEKYEEIYDNEFVNLYEIIYRDFSDIDYDTKIVFPKVVDNIKNKDDVNFLIGGCGVGKLCKKIKDKYKNVTGIDISENMLKKSQTMYPNIKFIRGNLCKSNIFDKNLFSHIYIDERTIHYNNEKEMTNIIQNSFLWLKENGFLIIQIYDPLKLQVACRYYSSNYMDNKKNLHGFTYLNDFSHDCYYINDEENKEIFYFYDKIILDNGMKRVKKTKLYIPNKEKIYDIILNNGFNIFHIENIRKQVLGGYELGIFRKKKQIISVDELEKNKL